MKIPQHLIRDAGEAYDHFTEDELEEYANAVRRKQAKEEAPYLQEPSNLKEEES